MHANCHQRVGKTLDLLLQGLQPFVERELKLTYGDRWLETAHSCIRSSRETPAPAHAAFKWDVHALLTIIWDQWNAVFRTKFGPLERSLISELREYRNRWAHQAELTWDDAYRVADSVERLLHGAQVTATAETVGRMKNDLLRERFKGTAGDLQTHSTPASRTPRYVAYVIYVLCAIAIMVQGFYSMGWKATALIAGLISVCTWYFLQKLKPGMPAHGLRECSECGRVIYQVPCPYCAASAETVPTAAAPG